MKAPAGRSRFRGPTRSTITAMRDPRPARQAFSARSAPAAAAVALLALGLGTQAPRVVADATASPVVDFGRDLEPFFKQQCVLCHNATLAQAGLRLDSREMALKGGLSGPALLPGNASASPLLKRLLGTDSGLRMPQNMEPWPAERIALVRQWIDDGAPWPAAAAAASGAVATPVAATTTAPVKSVDYARDIAPVFREHCVSCHGPAQQQSLLRLDLRVLALRGGLSGKVIVPGHGGDSVLVRRLRGQVTPRMPFQKDALPEDKVALLQAWIDAGAPGPDDAPADLKVATHWSYVKPVRPAVPPVTEAAWAQSPIDAFVLGPTAKGRPRPCARGRPGDASPPGQPRPRRPAAHPRRGRCVPGRPRPGRLRAGSSIGCWPRPTTASAGRDRGSTSPAMPTATATRRTTSAPPGRTATG